MFDVFFLKDIDFTNIETLIFFAIFLVIAIIVILIFFAIVAQIIKIIKRIVIRIFSIDVKKPKFNRRDTEWIHELKDKKENKDLPKRRINNDFTAGFKVGENLEAKKRDIEESYKEKEAQSISESLDRLKDGQKREKEPVGLKMASRVSDQGIEIPKPKRFQEEASDEQGKEKEILESELLASQQIDAENDNDRGQEAKIPVLKHFQKGKASQGFLSSSKDQRQTILAEKQKHKFNGRIKATQGMKGYQSPKQSGLSENKPITASIPKDKISDSGIKQNKNKDESVFGGASEISRANLESKLKGNTRVWQAARQEGLTLSLDERAKLIKDVPQIFGRNISKSDMKGTLRILNRKLSDARGNPEQHAKIRREIKFFKKIGGIK